MIAADELIVCARAYEYRCTVADYVEQSMERYAALMKMINLANSVQAPSSFRLEQALLTQAMEESIKQPVRSLLYNGYAVKLPADNYRADAEPQHAQYGQKTSGGRFLLAVAGIDPLTDEWSVITAPHTAHIRHQTKTRSTVITNTLIAAIRGPLPI